MDQPNRLSRRDFLKTSALVTSALELKELSGRGNSVTIEARLIDDKRVLCLDARNVVHFGIAGDGTLIDDLGTNTAARVVELYNGRAMITITRNGGKSEVSVSSKDVPTAFLEIGSS